MAGLSGSAEDTALAAVGWIEFGINTGVIATEEGVGAADIAATDGGTDAKGALTFVAGFTGGTGGFASTAIFVIVLKIGAEGGIGAEGQARRADTSTGLAGGRGSAWVFAEAAVKEVGLKIDAGIGTEELVLSANDGADAEVASFAVFARLVASAAMLGGGIDIKAVAVAFRESSGADTLAFGADLESFASGIASAAVFAIGERIDAGPSAGDEARFAATEFAEAIFARKTLGADIAARAAVDPGGFEIDALAVAFDLPGGTSTLSILAGLTWGAEDAASAAMTGVGGTRETSAVADIRGGGRAGGDTRAFCTSLSGFADGAASAAVKRIGLWIDADVVAKDEILGTLALAVLTDLSGIAAFAARAAVKGAQLGVVAAAKAALGGGVRALADALAFGTEGSCRAALVALAAVVGIGGRIDATVAAFNKTCGAATFAFDTAATGITGVAAFSTVLGVCAGVGAGSETIGRRRRGADGGALAGSTALAGRTGLTASAAVKKRGGKIRTFFAASDVAKGTDALAVDAKLVLVADRIASPAEAGIGGQIDAAPATTLGGRLRTFRDALAVRTEFLGRAGEAAPPTVSGVGFDLDTSAVAFDGLMRADTTALGADTPGLAEIFASAAVRGACGQIDAEARTQN